MDSIWGFFFSKYICKLGLILNPYFCSLHFLALLLLSVPFSSIFILVLIYLQTIFILCCSELSRLFTVYPPSLCSLSFSIKRSAHASDQSSVPAFLSFLLDFKQAWCHAGAHIARNSQNIYKATSLLSSIFFLNTPFAVMCAKIDKLGFWHAEIAVYQQTNTASLFLLIFCLYMSPVSCLIHGI